MSLLRLNRVLLSPDTEDESHSLEDQFEKVFYVMLFMSCLWFVGKTAAKCNMPALVGEILVGIILGPNLLQYVPESNAFIVIGEIGLVLLVLEAGIDVSISHLKIVGYRGLMVAIFGSVIPLTIGTILAYIYGESLQSSIAIGACLAPTSMGIALNVLRSGKVLNTPMGQLIIAAAVLDDVIALMLLSELQAMKNPTVINILLPLLISPAFIIICGWMSIKYMPIIIKRIMIHVSPEYHENIILFLLFVCTFTLIPVCNYMGSSHLLGAFLSGLMFCTDHTIHHAWNSQIKRIMQWMLRIFFSCTIGFQIPIRDFWDIHIINGALLYFISIVGKLFTGFFASPLKYSSFFTIAFSMSAWGEFAFILATVSYDNGTMSKSAYSSVLMAVLISVVVSPLLLRITLNYIQKTKQKHLSNTRRLTITVDGGLHPVYFCIHTKGRGRWGHQDRLLKTLFKLSLELIDFRAYHEIANNHSHHLPTVQDVFYVKDTRLALYPTARLDMKQEKLLHERCREIKHQLKYAIQGQNTSYKAYVDIMRWLPGVRKKDDDVVDESIKQPPPITYCRNAAYKQARAALEREENVRSSNHLSSMTRINIAHDALHRHKFTFHGDIHSHHTDDLVVLSFLDTLTHLHETLTPRNRSRSQSPDAPPINEALALDRLFVAGNGHHSTQNSNLLNADLLYSQVRHLEYLVEQMPQFSERSASNSHHNLRDALKYDSKQHNLIPSTSHMLSHSPPPHPYHENESNSHTHVLNSSEFSDNGNISDTRSSSSMSSSNSTTVHSSVMYANETETHEPLYLDDEHMDGIAENDRIGETGAKFFTKSDLTQYHSDPNVLFPRTPQIKQKSDIVVVDKHLSLDKTPITSSHSVLNLKKLKSGALRKLFSFRSNLHPAKSDEKKRESEDKDDNDGHVHRYQHLNTDTPVNMNNITSSEHSMGSLSPALQIIVQTAPPNIDKNMVLKNMKLGYIEESDDESCVSSSDNSRERDVLNISGNYGNTLYPVNPHKKVMNPIKKSKSEGTFQLHGSSMEDIYSGSVSGSTNDDDVVQVSVGSYAAVSEIPESGEDG